MAAVLEETPTGIRPADLKGLDAPGKLTLARWLLGKEGIDEGGPFYPRRIRDLPIETRVRLAGDPETDLTWQIRERRRVEQSFTYFVEQYGSIEPEEGPPIPFDLWPEQHEVAVTIAGERKVIVLKARQLGLTWLALHYAVWLMLFNPATPKARVLVLSKKGGDAEDLLERARRIIKRLPPYLRAQESKKTRDSNSKLKIAGRGSEMRSLMGTAEAARSFTATLLILDEFAFYRNGNAGPTWTAAQPTLRGKGRAVVISTGNGEVGDGMAFSKLWHDENDLVKVFLPYGVDPARRVEGWRDVERRNYLTEEDFEQEYPENEEQAFAGLGAFKVYPPAGIAAALRIGQMLEAKLPELVKAEGIEWGIDWGDFQTFGIYGVPLPGGGMYLIDEAVLPHVEPSKASEQLIFRNPAGFSGATFKASYADASPIGTNNTFANILREAYNAQPDRFPRVHTPVSFGDFKEGGREKRGVNTVGYIRSLLDAAEDFTGTADEVHGVLAIGRSCQTLAAQMRNLSKDAETGKVVKPALDPRHVERGDHGPDALVSLMAGRAARWRASRNGA